MSRHQPYPPGGHVLITGTSTGIGHACTDYLARRGFTVLAAARPGTKPHNVRDKQVRALEMDVADAWSIAHAAEQVRSIVGDDGLRGLVNNAGICVAGPVESLSMDDWRRQFDVNVFGPIAVTQAMLPLLRMHTARHGRRSARIVMISSIAGRVTQPIVGAYCASKHALESVGDALRNELKPEGIALSLVEPGAFKSEIWRKAVEQTACVSADDRYAKQIAAIHTLARRFGSSARPAERVARVVADCLLRYRPPARVLVGADAKFVASLKAWLPDRWLDSLLRWSMDRANPA